ncbi:hypothetical protein [Gimesia sp.]|uniref:hypothetical protein n=1 Tax=Gimesia sp. TaxID=2024833 RepID=UPI003A8D2E19
MLSRVIVLLNSLLYGPVTLCVGLFVFLISVMYLTSQEIQVDVDGMPLSSRITNVQPMSDNMRELLELSSKTGWKKDPKVRARVMELSKVIEEKKTLPKTPEKKPKAVLVAPKD